MSEVRSSGAVLPLSSYVPVSGVVDDLILSRDGGVTIGWELSLPEMDTLSEADYERFVEVYAAALRSLPDWTVVHRQDWYVYRDYCYGPEGHFLNDRFTEHFGGRRFLEHRPYVFFSFNPLRSDAKGTMKEYRASAAFGFTGRSFAPERFLPKIREFVMVCTDFVTSLESVGIGARRLLTADLEGTQKDCGLLQSFLQLGDRGFCMEDFTTDADRSHLSAYGKTLFAYAFSQADDLPSEVYTSVLQKRQSADGYPIHRSYISSLGSDLECEHIVNTYYVVPPQQDVLRDLEKRRNVTESFSGNNSENTVNAAQLQEFINGVYGDSMAAVYTHSNVMVWGDRDRGEVVRGRVSTALKGLGVSLKPVSGNLPVLFYSAMPGGELELSENSYMLAELRQSLCLGIYETFTRGVEGGDLRLVDRYRHVPVPFDMSHGALKITKESMNAFVLGPSGSGKSFFTNWYVKSQYYNGAHVFIIDKGGSYEGTCMLINEESGGKDGVYNRWTVDNPMSFSMFRGWRSWLTEEDGYGLNYAASILKTIWQPDGGWNSSNEPVLVQFLKDFIYSYSAGGKETDPVFQDFFEYLGTVITPRIMAYADAKAAEDWKEGDGRPEPYRFGHTAVTMDVFPIDRFDTALTPFSLCWKDRRGRKNKGTYSYLLNNPDAPDLFSNRFSVFELKELVDQGELLYSLVTFCIMHSFEEKMRDVMGFKMMVIEEAWEAVAKESFAGYIKSLWKTARKYDCQAMVVTQQVEDIVSSPVIKDAIINNSPIKVLLDQSGNASAFADIAELMGLGTQAQAMVKSVGLNLDTRYLYREVFITLGGRRDFVFAVEVSRQEALINESDIVKKAPLLNLAREKGMREAADELAGRNRK